MRPATIKQWQLRDILAQRTILADLRRSVKQTEDELAKAEQTLIYAVEHGAPAERGPLSAGVTVTEGARRPAWKDEFSRIAGPEAVEAVIARTPAPARKALTILGGDR